MRRMTIKVVFLHSWFQARNPSRPSQTPHNLRKIAPNRPPLPPVTRVRLMPVCTCFICGRLRRFSLLPSFSHCSRKQGTWKYTEGSIIWPPWGRAQTSVPSIFICGRNRARTPGWRPRERRSQDCERSEEDEPGQLYLHQSPGKRQLWKGWKYSPRVSGRCPYLFCSRSDGPTSKGWAVHQFFMVYRYIFRQDIGWDSTLIYFYCTLKFLDPVAKYLFLDLDFLVPKHS